MKDGVTVINVMADGTICDDLSTYLEKSGRELPEITQKLILKFIREGHALREKNGG